MRNFLGNQWSSGLTIHQAPNLLFEMLRSFVELATSLNLSRATEVTGLTRQTLKRHISNLEELRGAPLFELVDRRYVLTEEGEAALPEAKALLERSVAWVRAENMDVGGLQKIETPDGSYSSRQLPLQALWENEGACTNVYDAWTAARGIISQRQFDRYRSRLVIFRPLGEEWICVWLGSQSLLAELLGEPKAASAVGLSLSHLLCDIGNFETISSVLCGVNASGDARLDRVRKRIESSGDVIDYMRLCMTLRFPDGSTGVGLFCETYP